MILRCLWILFYSLWWFTITYCGSRTDWGQYTRVCAYFLLPFYFFVYTSWLFEGIWYFPFWIRLDGTLGATLGGIV